MGDYNARQSSATSHRVFYGYVVVAASSLIMVVAFGVHYAFGVFLKPMLTEFDWTRAMTSGAFSLSWIVQGISSIIMGKLNDKYGTRLVLTLCGFLLGAGYLLMSRMGTIWQFYIFYGLIVGSGLGGMYVPLVSTVARWFISRRNLMTGITIAGIGIGTLFGPIVANQLITVYDWNISYLILGSIVFTVIIVAAQFLKRDPSQTRQVPFNNEAEKQVINAATDEFSLRKTLHTNQFWLVFGLFFCFGFCLFAIMVHLPAHATDLGIPASTAATFLSAIGGASIAGKVLLGNIGDRIGNKRVYIICFILMSTSLLWLVFVRSIWGLYLFAIAFGFAYGGSATSQSPLVASLFGVKSHGLIMGAVNNGFTIGCTVGPIVAGYIFDVSLSYRLAFLVSIAFGILGLVFTLALQPIEKAIGRKKL